jgi:electron transfer flavoprotein beta subunit
LEWGADEGIHILDNKQGFRPAFLTASWIAAHARNKDYDLILTGIMSNDEMNSQTGPMIAQILSIPCCTAAIDIKIGSDEKTISVEREIEGGSRDLFDIQSPCVLTIQTGINNPRYPALSKVLRAKNRKLEIINPDFAEPGQHDMALKNIQFPESKNIGILLNGAIGDKVDQLIDILEKKALL